ncbi:glycosyltransferase 87 family protein [Actinoplanes sp. NPDC051513]|uniref:glycosyltransferase 87 family protein n=1 Tax=Actinoplanes sp. NPDC051513 TaxID=3363908 RepID=UPI00379DDFA0
MTNRAVRLLQGIDRAGGGLTADLFLYAIAAAFALITALTSTLLPHRAWGAIAVWPYAAATVLVVVQIMRRSVSGRGTLAWTTGVLAALLPLVVEAVHRAGGRTDRAQEEVLVVERMGDRLLHHGTPYLGRDAIAALPVDERLMGYSPYQPGMAVFGLPRAVFGDFWWTDARVWFAVMTVGALAVAVGLLMPGSSPTPSSGPLPGLSGALRGLPGTPMPPPLVRAVQAVAIVPICALTLATGGDDLPVLALCLLALALTATGRWGWAGVAVGAAAACKPFAFPVVAVLLVFAIVSGRWRSFLPGALGLPILVLIPPFLVNAHAFLENVVRFPLGHGLVTSPAQSPFPGYLIAQHLPGGRLLATGLLAATAVVIAVRLVRRPPRTAADAALICGWGLLAAILLIPSTRFGYLLYPIAFLAWAPALTSDVSHRAFSKHTA